MADVTKILCVDPGTPFGFAVWNQLPGIYQSPDERLQDYLIHAGNRIQPIGSWRDRSRQAADQLYNIIKEHTPVAMFCEVPRYMEGHAASAKGDLVKLCRTTGKFERVADECLIPFIEVEVNDWMGQMKGPQVRHRAEGVLGKEFCDLYPNEHALDAICIGLHVMGRWPG